jgi:hypothetical protein
VISKREAVGPTKEKAAMRSQKEDSREYLKRKGSRARRQSLSTQKRGSRDPKEEAALGTQNKAHCFRRRKREYEVMIIENKTKFRGG